MYSSIKEESKWAGSSHSLYCATSSIRSGDQNDLISMPEKKLLSIKDEDLHQPLKDDNVSMMSMSVGQMTTGSMVDSLVEKLSQFK